MSAFGTSKLVQPKHSVLLRAELHHICVQKCEKKKHNFHNDLTALVLILANSKIHQNKEKFKYFLKQM